MHTTTTVRPARALLPTFTLLLAAGAATLGIIAIATDEVGGAQPAQQAAVATPAPAVTRDVVDGLAPCRVQLAPGVPCRW